MTGHRVTSSRQCIYNSSRFRAAASSAPSDEDRERYLAFARFWLDAAYAARKAERNEVSDFNGGGEAAH